MCLGALWCLCIAMTGKGRSVVMFLSRYVTRIKDCCIFNNGLGGSDDFVRGGYWLVVTHGCWYEEEMVGEDLAGRACECY